MNGGEVAVMLVGEREHFPVESPSVFQLPMVLSALRLSEADEAQAIRAVNTR